MMTLMLHVMGHLFAYTTVIIKTQKPPHSEGTLHNFCPRPCLQFMFLTCYISPTTATYVSPLLYPFVRMSMSRISLTSFLSFTFFHLQKMTLQSNCRHYTYMYPFYERITPSIINLARTKLSAPF